MHPCRRFLPAASTPVKPRKTTSSVTNLRCDLLKLKTKRHLPFRMCSIHYLSKSHPPYLSFRSVLTCPFDSYRNTQTLIASTIEYFSQVVYDSNSPSNLKCDATDGHQLMTNTKFVADQSNDVLLKIKGMILQLVFWKKKRRWVFRRYKLKRLTSQLTLVERPKLAEKKVKPEGFLVGQEIKQVSDGDIGVKEGEYCAAIRIQTY
ncbi:hypothetical protein L1987_06604 [Smallanthus sonchifolius]|uniref:Uncharacterized protein n=1 Tax=Smallanthus sonchifolius TaxID=185202 RepID=A0ACB9JYT4_9ASTR|nr:hypothetical protein L1987_06604 [Smallanthus sonchifolius]